jgi:signal transduction histidine kinase
VSNGTEKLRVLVVDDEPGMRLGVVRTLRDLSVHVSDVDVSVGFDVQQAESGEAALERATENSPHIVLLDYKLPGMNGIDVLDHLREMDQEMLAIMITAYASLETAVRAMKLGAYDFLAKPFTPEELRYTIRKATNRIVLAEQARKLAQEKRQVRFQFLSVLAHELKAPLGAVEGFLRIVSEKTAGDNPEMYDQMVDRSLTRLEQMRKLIADLLDLTRIESGQKKRVLQEIDVRQVAERAVETATPAADDRDVSIHLDAPQTLPMQADESELEIILNNLISNAVKYNREGGRVDVVLQPDDEELLIEVSDTGIGMSQEEADKLFGEFVRIKNEKTRGISGSGLGLSILKKLVSLYDGDVQVSSEPDVGTTFTVRLQRPQEEAEAAEPEDQDEE